VAFPDFHAAFGIHLIEALNKGHSVGVAIGDVDHLKIHVENSNATDPEYFGHLAGNALMARLGELCSKWFRAQPFPAGCASTFGGDEVIITATVDKADAFRIAIATLRDRCRQSLPCTVSFALTVVTPDLRHLADRRSPLQVANFVLAGVDRTLFACKSARGENQGGLLATVEIGTEVHDHFIA
jgi:GGDEF domain-containing protein